MLRNLTLNKMTKFLQTIVLILFTVALTACGGGEARVDEGPPEGPAEEVEVPADPSPEADADADAEAEEDEEEDFDPYSNMPKPKSDEELRLLGDLKKEARELEMDYFGSDRLREWIGGLGESEDEEGMPMVLELSEENYNSLTARERIYHYLYYPESWDQVCAESMFMAGEVKALSKSLPYDYSGYYQTERQRKGLDEIVDSVDYYLLDFLETNLVATDDLLRLVVDQDLNEAIPFLVKAYREKLPRNDLYLSAMMELMSSAKYADWEGSDLRKEMGEAAWGTADLTEVNADKVIYYAEKFYEGY